MWSCIFLMEHRFEFLFLLQKSLNYRCSNGIKCVCKMQGIKWQNSRNFFESNDDLCKHLTKFCEFWELFLEWLMLFMNLTQISFVPCYLLQFNTQYCLFYAIKISPCTDDISATSTNNCNTTFAIRNCAYSKV